MTIAVSTLADCPFSIANEYAQEYLRNAEAGGAESLVRVPWIASLPALTHRVRMSFGLHEDLTEPGRCHEAISLRWSSESRLFPNFRGTICFRIEGTLTRILIEGNYDPPLGALGEYFDSVVGQRIARSSLQDMGNRLAAYLEQRQRVWRQSRIA